MQISLLVLLVLMDVIVRSTVTKALRKSLLLEWGMSPVQQIMLSSTVNSENMAEYSAIVLKVFSVLE